MNLDSTIVGRDLLDLRDAIARDQVCTPPHAWIPVRVSTRFASGVRAESAERELARVHVIEVARLLREAALLRRATRSAGADESDAWRRRARSELECWRIDGFESPAMLRFCAGHPIGRWAAARVIAEEALALDPCAAGRDCLACVES